jgi:hypothetical protein
MPTIININIGGSPLLPSPGDRAFKHIPTLPIRAFTPTYFDGLTPIPDQIFTRAKNCKKGQACGNSCISLAKTCANNLTPAQKLPANKVVAKTVSKSKSVKPANQPEPTTTKESTAKPSGGGVGYSNSEQDGLQSAHNQNLYGIAMGQADARDTKTVKRQDALIKEQVDHPENQSKIDRLVASGLSREEALGVLTWVGSYYQPINKSIYGGKQDKDDADYGEGAGIRATQGLRKMPSYTHDEMQKMAGKMPLNEAGVLKRGIQIDDVDAFVASYEKAIGKDDFKEPSFFATSASKNTGFLATANVVYEISAKADGTGQGKAVDNLKNKAFEGEVLYPPYSRFRVTAVERGNSVALQSSLSQLPSGRLNELPREIKAKIKQGSVSGSDIERLKDIAAQSLVYASSSPETKVAIAKNFKKEFGVKPLGSSAAGDLFDRVSNAASHVTIKMEEI